MTLIVGNNGRERVSLAKRRDQHWQAAFTLIGRREVEKERIELAIRLTFIPYPSDVIAETLSMPFGKVGLKKDLVLKD